MRISRWLLPCALTVLIAVAAARPARAGISAVGLKGGLSVATLHGRLPTDGLIENGSKLGFGGGVSLTIPLGRILSLQPELIYAAKGTSLGTVELTDSSGAIVGTAELLEAVDYLELPLLARVSFPTAGPASPYLLAGPVVGVRLTQRLQFRGDVSLGADTDRFRRADLGLALGAGVELGRGQVLGTLDGRYTLGLTTATEDGYGDDARNGDLLIMTGVAIRR